MIKLRLYKQFKFLSSLASLVPVNSGVAAICSFLILLSLSDSAFALRLRIDQETNLVSPSSATSGGNQEVTPLGTLGTGSVVDIPDHYVVFKFVLSESGKFKIPSVDFNATLENWLKAEGHDPARETGDHKFYFPVNISKSAPSTSNGIRSENTYYAPLLDLARQGKLALSEHHYYKLTEHGPVRLRDRQASRHKRSHTEAQVPCAHGNCSHANSKRSYGNSRLSDLADVSSHVSRSYQTPYKVTQQDLNCRCDCLMGRDGTYGNWGERMEKIMTERKYIHNYLKPNALGGLCPRFSQLSTNDKLRAWMWFWSTLARNESSCRIGEFHDVVKPNGEPLNPHYGHGLWAFEKDDTVRKWRDEPCYDIISFDGQARCAIDTMNRTLSGGFPARSNYIQYWGPMLSHRWENEMKPRMRRFTACGLN